MHRLQLEFYYRHNHLGLEFAHTEGRKGKPRCKRVYPDPSSCSLLIRGAPFIRDPRNYSSEIISLSRRNFQRILPRERDKKRVEYGRQLLWGRKVKRGRKMGKTKTKSEPGCCGVHERENLFQPLLKFQFRRSKREKSEEHHPPFFLLAVQACHGSPKLQKAILALAISELSFRSFFFYCQPGSSNR